MTYGDGYGWDTKVWDDIFVMWCRTNQDWLCICVNDNCVWVYDVNMLVRYCYGYHDIMSAWADVL